MSYSLTNQKCNILLSVCTISELLGLSSQLLLFYSSFLWFFTNFLQIEELYKKAHAAIRENPEAKPAPTREVQPKR